MNIRKFFLPQLAAISIGFACMGAQALMGPEHQIEEASSAQLRTAYLECDRISAESRVDQNFMIVCQRVGDVLRDRDFGGDFERLLQWWRGTRQASRTNPDSKLMPACENVCAP